MKILILDDSDYKIKNIQDALREWSIGDDILVARSFQKGMMAIKNLKPDLVVLDMTLPTSERDDGILTGRSRMFGGREIIEEIAFEQLSLKVIVVTQFDRFGEPPKSLLLEDLIDDLHERFSNMFIGGIYYNNVDTRWREDLRTLLRKSGFVK